MCQENISANVCYNLYNKTAILKFHDMTSKTNN